MTFKEKISDIIGRYQLMSEFQDENGDLTKWTDDLVAEVIDESLAEGRRGAIEEIRDNIKSRNVFKGDYLLMLEEILDEAKEGR